MVFYEAPNYKTDLFDTDSGIVASINLWTLYSCCIHTFIVFRMSCIDNGTKCKALRFQIVYLLVLFIVHSTDVSIRGNLAYGINWCNCEIQYKNLFFSSSNWKSLQGEKEDKKYKVIVSFTKFFYFKIDNRLK